MLQNITLGDIGAVVAFIVGLIGGIATLLTYVKKAMTKISKESVGCNVKPLVDGVNDHITNVHEHLKDVEKTVNQTAKQNAENFIKTFLSQLDEGRKPSQSEFECFYNNLAIFEKYDGNGFVHRWIDRLVSEDKFDSRQRETLRLRDTRPKGHS